MSIFSLNTCKTASEQIAGAIGNVSVVLLAGGEALAIVVIVGLIALGQHS